MATLDRRCLLRAITCAPAAALLAVRAGDDELPPVRALTRGPKHHWFGYYDKLHTDPSDRYVLGMEVGFEHRSPTPSDAIGIGMVDQAQGDRWVALGTSRAWGWQQGCMLQWRPGSATEVLFNDRVEDRFICRLLDVESREERALDRALYALSPDGRWGVAVDFGRLNANRPGYGYAGVPDARAEVGAPADAGVERVDLETGDAKLIFSLADALEVGEVAAAERDAAHWFNHLLVSPDGERISLLHRWRPPGNTWWRTRMLVIAADGSDAAVVDPSGHTSHYVWRDRETLLAWTRPAGRPDGFYLLADPSGAARPVGAGAMVRNGHCTYLPDGAWILNDTYPDGDHLQHPYLFNVGTGRIAALGHFHSPREYRGEWRCDTHPRASRDGSFATIDSPHGGQGRQLYRIDLDDIVG